MPYDISRPTGNDRKGNRSPECGAGPVGLERLGIGGIGRDGLVLLGPLMAYFFSRLDNLGA
jgi:hypothetical protein